MSSPADQTVGLAALPRLIAERAPRVLVVGDAVLDTWLTGSARRLSREAPVPVVEVTERRSVPGGAANTAVALAALGARTRLLAVIGDDPEGAELHHGLTATGVHTDGLLVSPGRATVSKQRVRCADALLARWDQPALTAVSAPLAAVFTARLEALLAGDPEPPDAVVVGDYDLGGIPDEMVALLARWRGRIRLLVVDAHRPERWACTRPDLVTPNAAEAVAMLASASSGTGGDRIELMRRERHRLVELTGARAAVVVTLDRDGALLLPADPGRPGCHVGTRPAPEIRACGAGDVFTAALTAALCCSPEQPSALRLAQAAAETAIASADAAGTVRVSAADLAARLAPPKRAPLTAAELACVVAEHRRAGRRVVFTNGCFDVLHRGHVAYLEQARRLGEVLVVALNSDASVARLKGPDRPVNPASDRASVLAALRCVDHVTVFEEDTPIALLELIRPEVYAKGGDYTPQMLPETPVVRRLGGEVRVLDYLSDHSTTAIVRRIQDRAKP